MSGNYWGNGGMHKERLEEFNNLLPESGSSDKLEIEQFRAITRLYYRYYNDGDKISNYNDKNASIINAASFLYVYGYKGFIENLAEARADNEYEKDLEFLMDEFLAKTSSDVAKMHNNTENMLDSRYDYKNAPQCVKRGYNEEENED